MVSRYLPFHSAQRIGEIADLITAFAHVPRLGDELYLRDDRVLVDDFEEGVQLVHATGIAREGGGEVETETVDMHLQHPIAQAVHDKLKGARVEDIEGVAGTGKIQVEARVFRSQPVVGLIVDPAKTERRPEVISFRGVIVDDVENDLDARGVEISHHRFELRHLAAGRAAARVLGFRREEADRVVTPIVR